MQCIDIPRPGGPEVLRLTTRDVPVPAQGEVLIRVVAAGVNRGDTVQRQGHYPPPPGASDLPGLEVSGYIESLGPGVTRWQCGDAVCALLAGGGYAEYCVAPATLCLPVPSSLSVVEAAALPEACFTAWTMLWQSGQLTSGETVLIHGGASGVGTLALRMAHELGHTVYVTAGTAEKCEECLSLGAAAAINYREEDFVERLRDLTGGKGVDVILDMVGGDYVNRDLSVLATGGRIVLIAFQGGRFASFDIARMMMRRLSITGATLRSRSVAFKTEIAHTLLEKIWPLIDEGRIRPVIDRVYALNNATDAHNRMESGESM